MSRQKQYSKRDCIESLQQAAEILGHSPSRREYDSLDLSPSGHTITNTFDTWSDAQEKSGLEVNPGNSTRVDMPSFVNLTYDEWCSLTSQERGNIRNRSKRTRIKLEKGCNSCGYDNHPNALSFHHINPNEKEFNISAKYVTDDNWEEVKQEIDKCIVLCENCHRERDAKFGEALYEN